jgi:hypothetical protein
MTKSEGFAMTHGECQLIYVVHYSYQEGMGAKAASDGEVGD